MKEKNLTGATTIEPWWFTLMRILLGMSLAWEGIVYTRDTVLFQQLVGRTGIGIFSDNSAVLSFIIPSLSVLCGVFIGAGLFTRICSIIQIPVLIVAVALVTSRAIQVDPADFILSIITLFLLFYFAFKGSGQYSADEFFRSYHKAGGETGHTDKIFATRKGG